jgi:hypothetical protein
MALFFDAEWFDARLAERGLDRAVLAAACGLGEPELAEVFKDQRELSAGQVGKFAELLGAPPAEVAARAGISTPVPGIAEPLEVKVARLERRTAGLEAELAALKPQKG